MICVQNKQNSTNAYYEASKLETYIWAAVICWMTVLKEPGPALAGCVIVGKLPKLSETSPPYL